MYLKPDAKKIQRNFGRIAGSYDRANDWMSFGLLHRWRHKVIDLCELKGGEKILDCATGTGDLAFLFAKNVGLDGEVFGLDFTPEMIEVAREKEWDTDLPVKWVIGDVQNLNFENDFFDVCSISYGLRNVEDPVRGIREMARVVRPGGKLVILETGSPDSLAWRKIYGSYFGRIIPRIGGFIAGDRGPYEFLYKSSMGFPSSQGFVEIMNKTELFSKVECYPLMGGVSYIYLAILQ